MAGVNDILDGVMDLPVFPAVAAKVTALLMDAASGMGEVEKLARQDEALATAILRAGNSAAYGAAGKTFTLQQSLARLGKSGALRVVMNQKVSGMMERAGDAYGLRRRSLWHGSLFGAIAAEKIARSVQGVDPGLAYLCGLMRDIGKMAVDAHARRGEEREIADASYQSGAGTPFIEAERKTIGADHAAIGAALGERWKLPPLVCNAIRYHHEPPAPDHKDHHALYDVVHAGDVLCLGVGLGVGHDGLKYKVAPHVRRTLLPTHEKAAEYTAWAWTELCKIDPEAANQGGAGVAGGGGA